MVYKIPEAVRKNAGAEVVHIRMDISFYLPLDMAGQLELWGIHHFDSCEFDQDRCQFKLSAKTTLYQKGGMKS